MGRITRIAGAGLILTSFACGSSGMSASDESASAPAGGAGGAGGYAGASSPAGGKAGQAGAGGATMVSNALTPKGSLEIVLASVGAGKPAGKMKPSPSVDVGLRVDLGPTEAIVTPRWGLPSVFSVAEKGGALVLTGSTTVRGGDATDVWQAFALELDAAHKLTGQVSAVGQESTYDGSVGTSEPIAATGTVKADTTSPEAKAALPTTFTGGARLPWEAITVRFAEPVAKASALDSLRVDEAATAVPIAWKGGPDGEEAKSGIVTASGFLKSFDVSVAKHTVHVATGYVDAAGNQGGGASQSFDVLVMPKADTMPDPFATAVSGSFAAWGPAEIVKTGADGCVALGPVQLGSCDVLPVGVAGRSKSGGGTKLEVRYKVVITPKTSGLAPSLGALPALSVVAGTPGNPPVTKEIAAPSLSEVTPDGKFTSGWVTVSMPMQVSADTELGWALRAGSLTSSQACTAGPSEIAPVTAVVFVDSVVVK